MKKIILIPDSFKGTMSSKEICDIMERAIAPHFPSAKIIKIPVADGGEGSVDCFLSAVDGQRITAVVKGPYFEDMACCYGILPDNTAVIEMAACAGLPLVGEKLSAENTTTYGVGQLIENAVKRGCKRIIVGLGGSATNDGGAGAASALGVKFLNRQGGAFIPTGKTLPDIERIDTSGLLEELRETELITMCDIDNPLCGEAGAARVFAPQKGADESMVLYLDSALSHMADIVKRDLKVDMRDIPGSGAAGGMGGGMVGFLGAKLRMGIEAVLDTVRFDELLRDADLVLSGEGKIDFQSLRGKVVIGIARRTKKASVPLIAIVGDIGPDIEDAYQNGVTGIFSINRVALPFEKQKSRCKDDLFLTVDNIMRYTKSMKLG